MLHKKNTGIDLVAMNVNDLVVQGAEPLFFLDCFSCSKLEPDVAAGFVQGVAQGCRQAGCALIGGETAEMPGLYAGSEFDVVGTAIGAIRGPRVLPDTAAMAEGDVLLGLASSGIHSNGFSLVRKIIERTGFSYDDPAPWDPRTTLGLSLLTPTHIYVRSLLPLVQRNLLLGMAHITGGGLVDNIPRMLPSSLAADIDCHAWPLPPVFRWLKHATAAGGSTIPSADFARTFNLGIGMVLVVSSGCNLDEVIASLEQQGETVFRIGSLVKRSPSSTTNATTTSTTTTTTTDHVPEQQQQQQQHPACLLRNWDCWDEEEEGVRGKMR